MPLLTVIAWGVIAVLAFVPGLLLARRMKLRRLFRLTFAVLVSAAVLASLSSIAERQSTRVDVRIAEPASGTLVGGCRVHVRGTVVPPGARVGVAARSEHDDRWWLQPYVTAGAEGDVGTWSVEVFLGTATEGIDENFQLVALASADSILFDVLAGRHIWASHRDTRVPAADCPEGLGAAVPGLPRLPKSPVTIVRRVTRQ